MNAVRPWCCPEPRCTPLHALKGGDKPLTDPDPGETFLCFGKAPQVVFIYDGVEHINDVRSCTYTALKGVISFQENYDDWVAIHDAYRLALRALERHNAAQVADAHCYDPRCQITEHQPPQPPEVSE